ncbi:MAG: hypothetical protein AB7O65_09010 [Candidatus Korobacteraceae bacterium]
MCHVHCLLLFVVCVLVLPAGAQQQPPVRVNVLNVCNPGEPETRQISAALEMVPAAPRFSQEFEVARGRTVLPDSGVSHWVRLRNEFPAGSPFSNAQYSLSVESGSVTETLIVRVREPKEVVLVSIEDTVTGADPAAVLASNTPAERINVERFGKGSLVLARCPQGDQSAYQSLFTRATALLASYRKALGVRSTVGAEIQKLGPLPRATPRR